ncbi:MAG: DUF4317 family protein [Oscillibacter sp.]
MTSCFPPSRWRTARRHRLLSALRTSELKDAEARDAFYQQVIGSLDMGENNYLILLGPTPMMCPTGARTARWTGMPAKRCSATSSAASAR